MTRRILLAFLVVAAFLFVVPCRAGQDDDGPALDAAVVAEAEHVLAAAVDDATTGSLYWHTVRAHGDVDVLLAWLEGEIAATDDAPRGRALRFVAAHVHSRRGDLGLALDALDTIAEQDPHDLDLTLWRARLLDSLGEVEDARSAYESVLEATSDMDVKRSVHLRLALMGPKASNGTGAPAGGEAGEGKAATSPLAEFALAQRDADIRNRAAIVLAILDRPAEALDLFVVQGEGTLRFRAESRRAEWALRAGDAEGARDAAWTAVKAAELRRDRRYALALLVEAHRSDDSLPALIDRLAGEETLSREERELWIDQLREQSRYEEAIELFRESASGQLTRPMRRELLELEREAGREDRMIVEYRRLIDEEPDAIIWRTGLTQLLLERGQEDDAAALWPEYIAGQTEGGALLDGLDAQASLGLDELAGRTVERMLELDLESGQGLLALARMHRDRGRLSEAEAALDKLNSFADASDSVRFELAEAYEQIGRQRRAVEVMEGVRAERVTVAEDLEMRLAWLYSEIGEEKQALVLWKELWRRINSVPRRRYVEDRLMSVASRLGTLADVAIDLEEKMIEGTADQRDVGLLVRIYTRVNDPVSATEVLGDFMRSTGGAEVDVLAEEARIYLVCTDYHNYEKTIRRMIEVDPDAEGDYLRQLAMSQLERGRPDEARDVLLKLRDVETDSISREFEGGVLTLAGMHEDACVAYRKGIAEHPDRIESYLLLADLMRTLGATQRAVGMFQHLAETADRDDLFTIAIDGLLNMQADRPTIEWARRITLERLAGREDKNYLYQLLHDLAEEAGDKAAQIRALENSIAVAGTRRLSILRECMDLSSRVRGGVFYAPGQSGPTNAGNEPFYAFARRLIGLEEAVPPGVFLDLGQAFLADDDVRGAWQTFALARNLPDERSYRRQVAGIFETNGHRKEALRVYERLLRTSPSDVGLIAKVAQLHEQEGRDVEAFRFYERALDLLMSQAPITTLGRRQSAQTTGYMWAQNRDTFQTYYERVIRGLLITLPDAEAVDAFIVRQRAAIETDIAAIDAHVEAGADGATEIKKLSAAPRLDRRAAMLRRLYIAFDRIDEADVMDKTLLGRFPDDAPLLRTLARSRAEWGYFGSARGLAAYGDRGEAALRSVRVIIGEEYDELATDPIEPAEALRQVLPLLADGNRDAARALLRRVNTTNLRTTGRGGRIVIINGIATMMDEGQTSGATFMRLAGRLDDPDLALHFARGWFRASVDQAGNPVIVKDLHQKCIALLTDQHQIDFNRFVADELKEKPRRLAMNCGLLAQVGEMLGEDTVDIDELLNAIDESKVAVGWALPTVEFLKALPEESRPTALTRALENAQEGQRVHALMIVPFTAEAALSPEVSAVVRDYFAGDLRPAKEKGMLDYIMNTMAPSAEPVRNLANADLALEMIEMLREHIPAKETDAIDATTALILRQRGKLDEAVALALELQKRGNPPNDAYAANNARRNLFNVITPDAPDAFLAVIDDEAAKAGESVELTDKRIALVRSLRDPERLRQVYVDAASRHPEEEKYLIALESQERRAGRLLSAIALNEQMLATLRQKEDDDEVELTSDMLLEAMIKHAMGQSGGNVPASVYRQSYERMAGTMSFDDLKAQAERMGVALPGDTQRKIARTERQLASLWGRLQNPERSLAYWQAVEVSDRKKLAEAQAQAESEGDTSASGGSGAAPGGPNTFTSAPAAAGRVAAIRMVPAASAATGTFTMAGATGEVEADVDDSMVAVKKAIGDDDVDTARQTLRRLWRTFPRDDQARRFIRPMGAMVSFNWPEDEEEKDDEAEEEPTEEEKTESRERARAHARGGVDSIVRVEERERPRPESAWKVLAAHPFGVDEMKRVVRSRSANEVRSIKPVVLGLLEAARADEGDEAVRQALLADVAADRAGQKSLIQLFALLNESPELIGSEDQQVLDDLLRVLDPQEVRMLSRLAWLYAAIGAKDKAGRLYEYCAARVRTSRPMYYYWDPFASNQSVDLVALVKEIREHYEGDELVDLLDRVFAAVTGLAQDEAGVRVAVETFTELVGAVGTAERLGHLFDDVERAELARQRGAPTIGAELFAKTGRHEDARRCLRAAVRSYRQSDMPDMMYVRGIRNGLITHRLPDDALLDLFPEDMGEFPDPAGWLGAAQDELFLVIDEGLLTTKLAARPLAMIAFRLHAAGATERAAAIVERLQGDFEDVATRDRLLVLDVARAVDLPLALEIAIELHERQQLPAVCFGGLVEDVAALEGSDAANARFAELLDLSHDEALLAAGTALAREGDDADAVAALEAATANMVASRDSVDEVLREVRRIGKAMQELEKAKKERGKAGR